MTRQRILAASAALAAVGLLGSCSDSDGSSTKRTGSVTTPTTTEPSTSTAATTTTVPVRPADSPVEYVRTIRPDDGFDQLSSLVVDSARDRVYVVDSDKRRIVSFARDASNPVVIEADGVPLFFRLEGSLGAVDLDRDGSLWVAESGAKRILHLSPEGNVLGEIGSDTNWGRLFSVSIDRINGLVYGVDDELDVIVVFDRAGHELRRIAGQGSKPGQVRDVGSVEVLVDGSLWVADAGNHRVQHLAADGSVLQVIGPFASGRAGALEYANDVAVDQAGRIWVADYGGAVVVFESDGTPRARFGGEGDAYHPGTPVQLTFDSDGRLYLAERDRDVVYVYTVRLD